MSYNNLLDLHCYMHVQLGKGHFCTLAKVRINFASTGILELHG